MKFIEYKLTSDALYLGERPKKNTFKPCIRTIPFSQISGALNTMFGMTGAKAVGYLIENGDHNKMNYLIYSPRDRNINLSKVPLEVEFLSDVLAKVFVVETPKIKDLLRDTFQISLGGLRSKGFGRCTLERQKVITSYEVEKGILKVRIPVEEQGTFDIRKVIRPVHGYLFKPINRFTGNYVLAFFEGSEVAGPDFLITKTGRTNG